MRAVVAGPDRGLGTALEDRGVSVTRIEGLITGQALDEADISGADLYVLTDVEEATSIPIAKDVNPDLRVVVYAPDTIPEFVRGQVDFAMGPDVLTPAILAEELTAEA
ncbi:MAG: CTP synthetase [Halobacteriales archaeon]|nr:CTP synthetase [Halobacteriales archaeon]